MGKGADDKFCFLEVELVEVFAVAGVAVDAGYFFMFKAFNDVRVEIDDEEIVF